METNTTPTYRDIQHVNLKAKIASILAGDFSEESRRHCMGVVAGDPVLLARLDTDYEVVCNLVTPSTCMALGIFYSTTDDEPETKTVALTAMGIALVEVIESKLVPLINEVVAEQQQAAA